MSAPQVPDPFEEKAREIVSDYPMLMVSPEAGADMRADIASALSEATREAYEDAAEQIKERADNLAKWMGSQAVGTELRKELSLRAGELYEAERIVRRRLEKGKGEK